MTKQFIRFLIILLALLALPAFLVALNGVWHDRSANKQRTVLADTYSIRVQPAFLNSPPGGPVDSCVLIINEVNHPSLVDTLVCYSQFEPLQILISDNHIWTLVSGSEYDHCLRFQLFEPKPHF